MAFNIMDMFAAPAMNRLLQPIQSQQGIPNMLLTRPSPQNYPVAGLPAPPAIDPQTVAAVQGPAAPMAAPQGPQVAQATQSAPASQPFFNEDRKAFLNDLFTGWAAGSTPGESLAYGAKLTAANRKDRQSKNETVAWLKSKGMSDADASRLASSPPALNEYLKNMYEQSKPLEVNGRLLDPKTFAVLADFSDPNAKLTSDEREFQRAKADGFTGNFMDYQIKMKEAGRQQVNIDTGEKLPPGYRWKDPNNRDAGVQPIPGGPAEEIPAELAARIGLADNFLRQYDDIRKGVASGSVTGPYDRLNAGRNQSSDQAAIMRQVQSGVDALKRMLTGAGMNIAEADEYAQRYLPTFTDNADSAAAKLDQLKAELESTRSMALRGRGNIPSPAGQNNNDDPLGIR